MIILRIVLKEAVVFLGSTALFSVAVLLALVLTDSVHSGVAFLSRELLSGGIGPGGTPLSLWVKLFSPYIIIQVIRGFLWSQRSLNGRKWANLYFSFLLACVGGWSFWHLWDLFYFMYALGDLPAEIRQFVELEIDNLLIFIFSVILSIHCFRIFLNPEKGASKSLISSSQSMPT